jgi:lipopolysaccharide/colanic/teichoic acid biosynthesis glycosyltransferase
MNGVHFSWGSLAIAVLCAVASFVGAIWLRLGMDQIVPYLTVYGGQTFATILIYTGTLYAIGQQIPFMRRDLALATVSHVLANGVAWLLSMAVVYLQGFDRIGRGIFIIFGLIHLALSGTVRLLSYGLADRLSTPKATIVVGSGRSAVEVTTLLLEHSASRLRPVALVQLGNRKTKTSIVPVFQGSALLHQVAVDMRAACVVLAPPYHRDDELVMQLLRCRLSGIDVTDAVNLFEALTGRVPLDHVDDHWALFLTLTGVKRINQTLKRTIDVFGSLVLLVLTSPIMLLVAALIRASSPGPILYRQERLGLKGKPFDIIKFRTMVPDAEAASGAVWADARDPRVTAIGRPLRYTRLDELPQLFNVLRGDMSLVGPRPEREVFVSGFLQKVPVVRRGRRKEDPDGFQFVDGFKETINLYSTRLLVKPGLTGWAQVSYPYAGSLEESRAKFEYDLYYIKYQSILFDLAILARTVWMVLRPRGR